MRLPVTTSYTYVCYNNIILKIRVPTNLLLFFFPLRNSRRRRLPGIRPSNRQWRRRRRRLYVPAFEWFQPHPPTATVSGSGSAACPQTPKRVMQLCVMRYATTRCIIYTGILLLLWSSSSSRPSVRAHARREKITIIIIIYICSCIIILYANPVSVADFTRPATTARRRRRRE